MALGWHSGQAAPAGTLPLCQETRTQSDQIPTCPSLSLCGLGRLWMLRAAEGSQGRLPLLEQTGHHLVSPGALSSDGGHAHRGLVLPAGALSLRIPRWLRSLTWWWGSQTDGHHHAVRVQGHFILWASPACSRAPVPPSTKGVLTLLALSHEDQTRPVCERCVPTSPLHAEVTWPGPSGPAPISSADTRTPRALQGLAPPAHCPQGLSPTPCLPRAGYRVGQISKRAPGCLLPAHDQHPNTLGRKCVYGGGVYPDISQSRQQLPARLRIQGDALTFMVGSFISVEVITLITAAD